MGVVSCCSREWNVLCFGVSPGWPLPQEICSWLWAGPAPQTQNVQTAGPLQGPACFWFPAWSPAPEGAVRLLAVKLLPLCFWLMHRGHEQRILQAVSFQDHLCSFFTAFPALLVSIYALRTIQNEIKPACETGPLSENAAKARRPLSAASLAGVGVSRHQEGRSHPVSRAGFRQTRSEGRVGRTGKEIITLQITQ